MLREIVSYELVTTLIIICLLLIAVTKLAYFSRFNDYISLIGNSKYLKIYSRDQKFIDLFDGLLFLNLLISLSIFILVVSEYLSLDYSLNFNDVAKLVVSIGLFLLIKILIERLVGSLFDIDNLIDEYLFQKTSYKNYVGIALIPINALLIYSITPSKGIILAIISILILINLIGLIVSFKNHQNLILGNLFYFILYLCALEISPYIILYKLII